MCAIAGMLSLRTDDEIREKMLKTMERRGPDDRGVYESEGCCLLHARLAIIDPQGGVQPMELKWNQEKYVLVYNGELYNTSELREELIQAGHRFETHSDTEVVLRSYARWGKECVHKFNGIFAFAVWEAKAKRLFLARDRIGVKPLFYKLHEGGLIFGSEIKTILAYPTVRAQIDPQGASELLLIGPGRTPGCGVFRGIQELEPGCRGYFEQGRLRVSRYWSLTDQEHTDTFDQTAEKVRYLVFDAVRRQMVSDVPIGTFLSGGLDSSLITAICAREMEQRGECLKTFSVDYENNEQYFQPSKFQPNADPHYIRQMEAALPIDHHWCVLTPEDLIGALEDAVIARDLPGMADVDFSLLVFCRSIREHVKVALSGECADEIFGGYPWYRDPEVRALNGFPWAQNTQFRSDLLSSAVKDRVDPEDYVQDRYLETCRLTDVLPGTSPEEKRMKQMMNLNFRWFMQTLLDRKDRMSMYSGLEVRVPFCDYRIAEYLYSVPWAFKDYRNQEKGLLRMAMRDVLPGEVLWRKKSPYPKTFDPRYTELVTACFEKLLEESDAPIFEIVSRSDAKMLLGAEQPWPWYGQLMKKPQTIAYLLQMDFWLRHYDVEILI